MAKDLSLDQEKMSLNQEDLSLNQEKMSLDQEKISILVPVYGVERYIGQCAESLLGQTYRNIEYIFVDDCTPDDSIGVLRGVVARHPERAAAVSIVRHDHNRGSGAARLTAMSHATGSFVCFADSDDLMPADAVERLVERQHATGADIVDGAFDRIEGGRLTPPEQPPRNAHYAELMVLQNTVSHQLWARLIRRSLFADHAISFVEGVDQAEDYSVMARLAFCATRATTPAVVYHYRMDREGTFSDGISARHAGSVLAANRLVTGFLRREDHGHRCRHAARVGLVNACWQAVRTGMPIGEVRRRLGFPPRGMLFRLADALLAHPATVPLARAEYLLLKRLYRCRLSLADALRPLRRDFRKATHSSRITT